MINERNTSEGFDLEYKVQRIKEFKESTNEWLHNREWHPNEMYPFNSIEALQTEFKEHFDKYSIVYKGIEGLGETLTIGGEWPELGIALEINFNPIKAGDPHPFRVLYRWR
jgi:hypothetical protein